MNSFKLKIPLILLVACFTFLASAKENYKPIPPPPWAETGNMPTSNFQVLDYFFDIISIVPDKTFRELEEAQARNATPTELLAIVYGKRILGKDLNNFLIDYSNPNLATNIPGEGNLAAMLDELLNIIRIYDEQWALFYDSENPGNTNIISLGEMINSIMLLDELKKRINDESDSLDNLQKYTEIFKMPGAAFVVFKKGRKYVSRMKYERGEKLLRFLLLPNNKDGFTYGGALHFLAKVQLNFYKDTTNAYRNFLKVHNTPACLVFIAHSYINIAKILDNWNLKDQALAVLAVDVPNIDFEDLKAFRHLIAADICLNQCEFREALRHLQVGYLLFPEKHAHVREAQLKRCPDGGTQLWAKVSSNPWNENDEWNTILKSTKNSERVPEFNLFLDAVLHDWPAMDEIPMNVATNRLLNNNIFEQKRRTITTYSE